MNILYFYLKTKFSHFFIGFFCKLSKGSNENISFEYLQCLKNCITQNYLIRNYQHKEFEISEFDLNSFTH